MSGNNFNFIVKNGIVVNTVFTANSTVVNAPAINATSINLSTTATVGNNVIANTTSLRVGNTTVNTVVSAGTILINGTNVNTAITSNAATAYANAVANAAALYQTTAGLAANVATLTANNTVNFNSQPASFYTNATNITTGTLDTARLPATIDVATAINVGANSTINTTSYKIGNATVNTTISAGTILINGINVNTAITGNAATAYTNAINLAAATYQTTAGLAANVATLTANNSTNLNGQPASFYTNATNITTGTLDTARLPATVNVSSDLNVGANVALTTSIIRIGNSTVNTALSAGSITINGINVNTAITNNAETAYTNAISFCTNATNITTGTLATDRLPATVNVATEVNVGANVNLSTISLSIGNATINTFIASAQISTSGDIFVRKTEPVIWLNRSASGQNAALVGQVNGVNRWQLRLGDNSAESDNNTGSNFNIVRHNDAGASLGSVLEINRASGDSTFFGKIIANTGISVTSATVANAADLSRHLNLHSNNFGMSVTSNTLNIATGGNVNVIQGVNLLGRFDNVGTSAPNTATVMTREKGDARYVLQSLNPYVELTDRTVISGTPTFVEFVLPEGYIRYDFTFNDISPASNNTLLGFQLSRNNGSTWQGGTSDNFYTFQTSVSSYHSSGIASSFCPLSVSQYQPGSLSGNMSLYPSPADNRLWLYNSQTIGLTNSGNWDVSQFGGGVVNGVTRFNRIRFFWNSSTFANNLGSISIHGLRA